jgi:hypothetical protein
MVLLPNRGAEHFEAFRSILKRFKMEKNARAIVSMLLLDAFYCGLLRLVTVAPIPHRICSMVKEIAERLNLHYAHRNGS